MVRISLDDPKSGWVCARLSDGSGEFLVIGSYTPVDVLRDFVDAIQSLQSAETADCCWFQEPGELHWSLHRKDKDLEVEILNFPDIDSPGQHRGDSISLFKVRTDWLSFARQVLNSLESIKTSLGLDGYELAWRHPFPKEGYDKLQTAIQEQR